MTSLHRLVGLALLTFAPAALQAQSHVVVGTVEDSLGAPIPDVQIIAVGINKQVSTDAKGRFRLLDLPPGAYVLRVRRLGFESVVVRIELPIVDDAPLAIELRESVTDLAPVVIRRDGISPRLTDAGFEKRKQFSGAPPEQFVTRADFDRIRPIDLSQMLRRMSARAARCGDGIIFLDGVLMAKPIADAAAVPTATQLALLNNPNSTTAREAAQKATQDIARTGSPLPKPQALDLIPQNWIEGMEVYASPAQIPNEYRAAFREARCVILLWTR